ncbi:hypothetical protein SAZ11_39155 [Streptomyces sp. FXJ1.4098]|uniref:hypothetical protein n=1 Tax=Streptomyces sp. NPDC020845 TaxID=3365096 RepID=UPI002999B53D|nr:hypothetical protein [Streptomyces sp. FXJ1.4098]
MKIRTHRVVRDGDEVCPDGEGTRFFGVPAWRICLAVCAAMPIALLAYTYTTR